MSSCINDLIIKYVVDLLYYMNIQYCSQVNIALVNIIIIDNVKCAKRVLILFRYIDVI